MVNMVELREQNSTRWGQVHLTRNFVTVARRLTAPAAKSRYKTVEKYTGVPWFVIAVIHERESSQNWAGNLAQGDPWNRVSVHVPKGRGPFESWETAAIDALVNCSPYAAHNHDWSVGGTLTLLEEYNGIGYAARGRPSPYVWAGTDQYTSGKFIRDGVYDPDVVDAQLGCAGILKTMEQIDDSILVGGKVSPVTKIPDVVVVKPKPPQPATTGWLATILDAIKFFFGRG